MKNVTLNFVCRHSLLRNCFVSAVLLPSQAVRGERKNCSVRSPGCSVGNTQAGEQIQDDQKVSVHLTITVQKHAKIQYFKQFQSPTMVFRLSWRWRRGHFGRHILKTDNAYFQQVALRLIQRTCLWHSWTTCLRTESFLKPFGLQDLWIFLRPNFFSGVRWKAQFIRTIPT
jgi:hypothetical protein